jgi:hypothetical protein
MRFRRSAVIGVAVATLAVSPAAAQQDLRSPDTRDAASGRWIMPEEGLPAYPTPSDRPRDRQDLRSPDTRDAATGRDVSDSPQVTVVRLPQPAPVPAGGIDWDDVVMSAAVALVLIGLSTAAVLYRRRPHAAVSA